MSEPLDRRSLLASLIGAGLGFATLSPADARSSKPQDHQLTKLKGLVKDLQDSGDDMDGIVAGLTPPPPADIPEYIVALDTIIAECSTILAQAEAIQSSL